MLVNVVDNALVGGVHKMEHYSVAAKTGTAQLVEKGKKTYAEGEFIHTFFGYAPAFDAKFLTFFVYRQTARSEIRIQHFDGAIYGYHEIFA